MYQVLCWTGPVESNICFLHFEKELTDFINVCIICFHLFNLQPAAGCHIYDLERPAAASPDWDINHTNLEETLQFRAVMIND